MARLLCLTMAMTTAMALGSAAHAGSFSFWVAGHHVSISASRNCASVSCVSVSIPGLVMPHRKHSDEVDTAQTASTKAAPQAPAVVTPKPVAASATVVAPAPQPAPVASRVVVLQAPSAPPLPPPAPKLAASETNQVVASQPAPVAPETTGILTRRIDPTPVVQHVVDTPPVERPVAVRPVVLPPVAAIPEPAPVPTTAPTRIVDDEPADSPLGDWQTEGKTGTVRIEACGKALCGYLVNASSQTKGETILINMKPNREDEWRGSIISRSSGSAYNANMTLKSANVLRVEACGLGHFLCSGNNWTRVIKQPTALVTSRDDAGTSHTCGGRS